GDRDDLPRGYRLDRDGPREHARPRIPGRSPHEVAGRHLVGTRGEAQEARRDPGGPTPGRERGEEGEGPRRRGGGAVGQEAPAPGRTGPCDEDKGHRRAFTGDPPRARRWVRHLRGGIEPLEDYRTPVPLRR